MAFFYLGSMHKNDLPFSVPINPRHLGIYLVQALWPRLLGTLFLLSDEVPWQRPTGAAEGPERGGRPGLRPARQAHAFFRTLRTGWREETPRLVSCFYLNRNSLQLLRAFAGSSNPSLDWREVSNH